MYTQLQSQHVVSSVTVSGQPQPLRTPSRRARLSRTGTGGLTFSSRARTEESGGRNISPQYLQAPECELAPASKPGAVLGGHGSLARAAPALISLPSRAPVHAFSGWGQRGPCGHAGRSRRSSLRPLGPSSRVSSTRRRPSSEDGGGEARYQWGRSRRRWAETTELRPE